MKNKTIKSVLAVALVLALSACSSSPKNGEITDSTQTKPESLEGSITISGAFALYPLVNVWAEEFRKEYPNVRINVSGGGAGKGMADVLGGAAELGMFSRDISPEEKAQGVWWVSVSKDAVIPTISAQNPILNQIKTEGLTQSELSEIFLKEGKKKWKNSTHEVSVFTRSDAAGAADVWAKYLGGKAQEELKGIAVFGDPGLAEAVKNDPKGIGFNNVIYAYDLKTGKKYPGLEVIPIDINANGKIDPEEDFYGDINQITAAIADGRYPSPPARELYLISKGKPSDPIVNAFLNWVLEKGQTFVEDNGYILLKQDVIKAQKDKL
jgi:phosphate transport system substrate-binding protein